MIALPYFSEYCISGRQCFSLLDNIYHNILHLIQYIRGYKICNIHNSDPVFHAAGMVQQSLGRRLHFNVTVLCIFPYD